jgi:xanthine dehydrogenase accessory factor
MDDFLEAVLLALGRGERLALVTTVRAVGSTPRHNAARLAVFATGESLGSIGGGTMELEAIQDARAALAENRPRLVEYNLNGRGRGNVGLCGGAQEVFIDILEPKNQVAMQLAAIRAALVAGAPAVWAVIVHADGNELIVGSRQVVCLNQAFGTIGDTRLEHAITEQARQAMAEHYPQRLGFDPATGTIRRLASTRRATVEIFLDLYDPRPRLLIVGAGHIGAALARQGQLLDWQVEVVDDRPEFLTAEHLSGADATHLVAYAPETEQLEPLPVTITPSTAVVVATWGWDEPALRQLAATPAVYVGLVASLRKAAVIFERLGGEGIDPGWLNRVHVPVGLDVGAESPAEIALAIMAEILAVTRGKSGRPMQQVHGDPLATQLIRQAATQVTAGLGDHV